MNAEMTDFRRLRTAFSYPLNWQPQKPVTFSNSIALITSIPENKRGAAVSIPANRTIHF